VSGGPIVPVSAGAAGAARIELRGRAYDLSTRALVAAVVPVPRFGREGEVAAAVQRAHDARADLADVSLEPRLLGPVAGGPLPVCARVTDIQAAGAAHAAGAHLLLVPPALAPEAHDRGWPVAVVVDDVSALGKAQSTAHALGVPTAIDTAGRPEEDALAQESVAVAAGCRIVRTTDVRRSRRVVEVVAALLEARR
jgi:hypothetical protein